MRRIMAFIAAGIVTVVVVALFGGFAFQWFAPRSEQASIPMPGRLVSIDVLLLHLQCAGQGRPVMVVDVGAVNWSVHWSHIQTALKADGRICLYDRAGLGWSSAWSGEITGNVLTQQLHDLLEASGEPAPYLIVGHSLDGYIARLYEDEYADLVAGIAFVDSAHEDQFDEIGGLKAAVESAGKPIQIAVLMARFGLFRLADVPRDVVLPDAASQLAFDAALKTPKHWQAMRAIVPHGAAIAGEVQQIDGDLDDLPVLVLSAGASADSYCEKMGLDCNQTQQTWNRLQKDLLRLSTDSSQVVCASATHNIQIDDPGCVVDALRSFWRTVRGSSANREF